MKVSKAVNLFLVQCRNFTGPPISANFRDYSYRSASIGSSLAACRAG